MGDAAGKVHCSAVKMVPHIITSNIEHVAIDLPLKKWEQEGIIGEILLLLNSQERLWSILSK